MSKGKERMVCPTCGCHKLQAGPRGGLAQNFRCENHHYWNASTFGMQPIDEPDWAKKDVAPGCSCVKGDLQAHLTEEERKAFDWAKGRGLDGWLAILTALAEARAERAGYEQTIQDNADVAGTLETELAEERAKLAALQHAVLTNNLPAIDDAILGGSE